MPKIAFKDIESLTENEKALYNKVSELGVPVYMASKRSKDLFSTFTEVQDIAKDDHENLFLQFIDKRIHNDNSEGFLLIVVNDVLYSVYMNEVNSIYVSEPLVYEDLYDIFVISDIANQSMVNNIIDLNNILFNMLYTELNGGVFRRNYPWIERMHLVSDNCIKIILNLKQDSNRNIEHCFTMTLHKTNTFDTIQNLNIDVTLPCLPVFTKATDLEGYAQDLNLLRVGVQEMYNYIVSKYLYNLGIESINELPKLNNVTLGKVTDTDIN